MFLPLSKTIFVCLFPGLCCCTRLDAQYEEKSFIHYSVKDGLSDNYITCLQQDEQGYLWIGTDAGLNRFDGTQFKKFYQGSAPLHLLSPSIWRLKRFGPEQLVIINKAGFQLLNTRDYSVQDFFIPDSTAFGTHLNSVWEVIKLPDGSYAVTTAAGFYVFNQAGKITMRHDAYHLRDIGKKRILYGRDFFKVADKRYLVYVEESGLAMYDDEKKKFTELDPALPEWGLFRHARSQPGDYWIVKQQLSNHEFLFVPNRVDKIIYHDQVLKKTISSSLPPLMADSLSWESKFVPLDDSSFAVNSSTNGFYILKLNRKTGVISCDGKKFLRNYKINCLFLDKDNRLWAGTQEGLLKQELYPPAIQAYHYNTDGGEKHTGGFSCAFRYKKKLYAGRYSLSKGLVVINPVTMQLEKEVELFGAKSSWNQVRTIEMYHEDTLWLGTNAGLLWYDTESGRYGKVLDEKKYPWAAGFVPVLAPPRADGYVWMCSLLGGKVIRYHIPSRTFTVFTSQTKPALPFDRVKRIVYDSYGDVWISGHSLARWNNRSQIFDTLITVYGGKNKFNDDIVTISADANGSLWVHNANNGLLEYRIREKKFVAFSMKEGLPSDGLHALSPVIDHQLWMAGSTHLTLFDTRTKQFTVYDNEDGLPEDRPTGRKIYFDTATGQLYLCSSEYLVRFPFHPEKKRSHSSELLFEEFNIDNKRIFYQPAGTLRIKYNEDNLTLNYTIIDFDKSNYQFAWRLDNQDQWNSIGRQHSINLSNLPPGHYNLQVKASGKPGIEKIRTLSFFIRSPFWKTPWFIGLAFISLAVCAWLLYRNRIRSIRQKANIDKLLSQTEMKALQAQMNPHFIFNSLNSIREMILNNENKEASHYLSKFAHLIRITLDQSTRALVSLRSTVDYLQRYMEMESIRNSLFTYQVMVDPELDADDIDVPPMLIQPFIENALWHGVSATNKKIHIKIDFKKSKETLICQIDDNGIGIRQSQKTKPANDRHHRSHGIANIRNRFELLNEKYGLHGRFTIEDKKEINGDNGTRVTLYLPIEIKET